MTVAVVSLSPAVDRVALVTAARRGGVRRATEFLETAGGKGAHVAAAAAALGAQVRLIATADATYARLLELPAELVAVARTRGTYTVVDAHEGDIVEVHEPAVALAAPAATALRRAATAGVRDAAVAVTTGSVPPGLDKGLHAEVVRAARGLTVVDTSDPDALRAALAAEPYLVKPNLEEAQALLGAGEPRRLVAELRARGARNAWLTLGADGSLLATPAGVAHLRPPPVPRVVNAVGAGDALLGGLAAGLAAGEELVAAARLGVAAAATKVARLHPGEIDPAGARTLARAVKVTSLPFAEL